MTRLQNLLRDERFPGLYQKVFKTKMATTTSITFAEGARVVRLNTETDSLLLQISPSNQTIQISEKLVSVEIWDDLRPYAIVNSRGEKYTSPCYRVFIFDEKPKPIPTMTLRVKRRQRKPRHMLQKPPGLGSDGCRSPERNSSSPHSSPESGPSSSPELANILRIHSTSPTIKKTFFAYKDTCWRIQETVEKLPFPNQSERRSKSFPSIDKCP